MNTIVRKFSEALENVPMSHLLNIAKRYIKNFGYDKDAVLEDVVTNIFNDLNHEYHYVEPSVARTYAERHIDDLLYVLTDVFPELDEEIDALDNKHLKETKKLMYESIMKLVSKSIKKRLNEDVTEDVNTLLNVFTQDVFKPLTITVNLDVSSSGYNLTMKESSESLVKSCAGYIIEEYVYNLLTVYANKKHMTTSELYNSSNKGTHYDFDLTDTASGTTYKFEVKALLNGDSSNLKLTKQLLQESPDYIFICVNYYIKNMTIYIKTFNIIPGANVDTSNFLKDLRRKQTSTNKLNTKDYRNVVDVCKDYLKAENADNRNILISVSKYLKQNNEKFSHLWNYDDNTWVDRLMATGKNSVWRLIGKTILKAFNGDADLADKWFDKFYYQM